MLYFKKEIMTNAFNLKSGEPVAFRRVKGQTGVIAVEDKKVSDVLLEASRRRMGGIIEIDEDTYREMVGAEVCASGALNGAHKNGSNGSTWNGHNPTEPGIVNPPTFYHSGDLGDVIYGLLTIKEIAEKNGGAIVQLGPDNRTPMPTREPMLPHRVNLIAPLIAAQPYVNKVEYKDAVAPEIDYDLNQFRNQIIHHRLDVAPGMNLARCHLKHFDQRLEADEKPWISVDEPLRLDGKSVVIARTVRYHNPRFNWREVMRRYGSRAVFVGTESEWQHFCREFGPIDYHKTANLLDVARVIAGAKLFIGNQSCPYAIAEGMKQNAILEVAPQAPNCMFSRPNAWAVWRTPFQLPALESLESISPVKRKAVEFNEDYFMRGQETGVSNYTNYSWMPDVTPHLATAIVNHLKIKKSESVLDYGCARGFLVRALREMKLNAVGCDVSEWAIQNCDETVANHVFQVKHLNSSMEYDWIVAKDVLEHVPLNALETTVKDLLSKSQIGMFIVVPLTNQDGGDFICPRDNQDATHVVRWTLSTWLKFLRKMDQSFIYHGSFHVPGIKQASEPFEASCGFITAKRI